jgi:hypothetical protein
MRKGKYTKKKTPRNTSIAKSEKEEERKGKA